MSDDALPEPDRVEGAPHPRETENLVGQDAAASAFLEAFNADRLHHGWLLTGPRGVGKATLAWQIARFLLATPMVQKGGLFGDAPPIAKTLDIAPDHPVSRRIQAGSEPGLFPLRRAYDDKAKRLKTQITVDEVRRLKSFFALSATEGGRRVVIVDAADEMNPSAANALLKTLEEPPANTVLLLVSHQPSRLLPTIRSRCRELRLAPLSGAEMSQALQQAGTDQPHDMGALTELSGGSVGEALRLLNLGGLEIYAELVALFSSLPRLDRQRGLQLADAAATRGAENRLDLLVGLIEIFLSRLARSGALGSPQAEAAPGESALLARLSSNHVQARIWANTAEEISSRLRHGRAVNLDPSALILDTVFKIRDTASG